MSTLSLEDLGPEMRRNLGLEPSCRCAGSTTAFVASIPVVEARKPGAPESVTSDPPGAAWLRTGLHRLRVPRLQDVPDRSSNGPDLICARSGLYS